MGGLLFTATVSGRCESDGSTMKPETGVMTV